MKNPLTLTLPCKPYVRRFIEHNFGLPADISRDEELFSDFRKRLSKNSHRHDRAYATLMLEKYAESAKIIIPEDDFYRYGWELSTSDIVKLNKHLECRIKILVHTVVSSQLAFGFTLSASVDYFMDTYEFPEDVWKKESIIKECQRNLKTSTRDIHNNLVENINMIIVDKLAASNILSKKGKNKYVAKLSEKRTTLHKDISV